MNKRSLCFLVSLLVVFSFTGCGGPKYPPTFKTTGTVTLDGKPIEGATVSFYPDGTNKPANGETDSSGQYLMSSFNKNDGATVGAFRVTVQKQPKVEYESTPEGTPYDPSMESSEPQSLKDMGQSENSLPKMYADPETSGLTATVVKGDSNVVNFELSSK